jgi:hypothetical protein
MLIVFGLFPEQKDRLKKVINKCGVIQGSAACGYGFFCHRERLNVYRVNNDAESYIRYIVLQQLIIAGIINCLHRRRDDSTFPMGCSLTGHL